MRILGLDIETTGLDSSVDYVTEVGYVILDTKDPKPFLMRSEFCGIPANVEITDEIYQLTKIKKEHLHRAASLDHTVAQMASDANLYGVEAIVAHNGLGFDIPFLAARSDIFRERLQHLPVIDTAIDVDYPADCKIRNLTYLCGYHGFVNPFPHAALSDVQAMLKVLLHYDVESIFELAKTPLRVVSAGVSYHNRELAKERGYRWESLGDKKYPKQWVKHLREARLAGEQAEAGFPVTILE